jgi:hypothetical protein
MTVTFQVGDREFGGSGNLEIDFTVRTPHSSLIYLPFFSNLTLVSHRSKLPTATTTSTIPA